MYKILCLSTLLLLSSLFHQVAPAAAATRLGAESVASSTSATTTATTTIVSTTPANQIEIEKRVREYFADIPVMIDIARCESKFRQFTDAGNVLRGGAGGEMVGVFQFFERIHSTAATNLGFDLLSVDGNIGYARQLYGQAGSGPWASCAPAVASTLVSPPAPSTPQLSNANTKLKIELLKQVIVLLQELLKLKLAETR